MCVCVCVCVCVCIPFTKRKERGLGYGYAVWCDVHLHIFCAVPCVASLFNPTIPLHRASLTFVPNSGPDLSLRSRELCRRKHAIRSLPTRQSRPSRSRSRPPTWPAMARSPTGSLRRIQRTSYSEISRHLPRRSSISPISTPISIPAPVPRHARGNTKRTGGVGPECTSRPKTKAEDNNRRGPRHCRRHHRGSSGRCFGKSRLQIRGGFVFRECRFIRRSKWVWFWFKFRQLKFYFAVSSQDGTPRHGFDDWRMEETDR